MNAIKTYHFIGIGGAGMSAIATVLLERGAAVSGSDMKTSRYTKELARLGAKIHIGHRAANAEDAHTVVVSSAIPEKNPELVYAKEHELRVLRRAEMLAELADGLKCIAVAGTHGKTTTSSMISLMLEENGARPTYVIGGELNDTGTNAKAGEGEYLVAEADESDASFLALSPTAAVVTNIEADHLDFYQSLEHIEEVFLSFLEKVSPDGIAIVCGDDKVVSRVVSKLVRPAWTFGLAEANRFSAREVRLDALGSSFSVFEDGAELGGVTLKVPGIHNVLNALAACAVGRWVGLDFDGIVRALGRFSGVKRRFQVVGRVDGLEIVDDYAHHPTEVQMTLEAARTGDFRRVIGVFQPHRYTRTQHLARDFGPSFAQADVVVLTEVYPAGETPIPGVSGKLLVESVLAANPGKTVAYMPRREQLVEYLLQEVRAGDVVITMGAGDISALGEELKNRMAAKTHG